MAPALLTAIDSTSHVHLIVGSNPLAGARCTRSVEVGAKPILIAPENATLHYGLARRIDDGEVQWLKRDFKDEDLTSLGRSEVEGVVDAVFVTTGGKQALSEYRRLSLYQGLLELTGDQALTFRACAAAFAYQSTSPTRRTYAPLPFCPRTPTALCKSA